MEANTKSITIEYLFNKYHPELIRYGYSFARTDLVEDATMIAFESISEKLGHFSHENQAWSYLFKSTKHTLLNLIKHEKRINARPMQPQEEYEEDDFEERLADFYNAVDNLPPDCRKCFELRHICGLGIQQIAQKLKISPNTVRCNIVNAKKKILKSVLNKGTAVVGGF